MPGSTKSAGNGKEKANAHTTTVCKIDAVIRSQKFWAAARIVREVGFQAELIGRWSESCPCHEEHNLLFNWVKSSGSGLKIPPPPQCDWKGRRSPDLATGEAIKMLEQSASSCQDNIVEFVHSLDSGTQHSLKRDWEHARSKIVAELTLKLATWKYLPNLLCGLAHHDHFHVQQCAQRALMLWEQQSSGCSHAQSRRFLDPGWSGLDNDEQPLRPIVS